MQRAKEIITGFKAKPHSRSLKASTSTTAKVYAVYSKVVSVYVTKMPH